MKPPYNSNFKISILCAAFSIAMTGCNSEDQNEAQASKTHNVEVMSLATPDTVQNHQFSGVTEAELNTELSFRVGGTIEDILVDEGELVKAGDVIVRLDPHDFQVEVNELTARLDEARSVHKLAKIELNRVKNAISDNAIADIKLDRAKSAETRAKAQVDLVEQSLRKAKDALTYSELKAPFDGVVALKHVENHEFVTAGKRVVAFHQPNKLKAIINVPESHIWNMKKGMKGEVSWFKSNQKVPATVTQIASIPDPLKRTYEVTFTLENTPKKLVAGKAVNVSINLPFDTDKDVFCLPSMAVVSKKTNLMVKKVTGNTVSDAPVTLLAHQQGKMCVTGDIAQNDKVITAGASYVNNGDSITIIKEVANK